MKRVQATKPTIEQMEAAGAVFIPHGEYLERKAAQRRG